MISEKIIAKEFNGLWEQVLPLLTPNFVSLFNAANSRDLTELPGSKFRKIPIGDEVKKYDLVAELSFQIAKSAASRNAKVSNAKVGGEIFTEALGASVNFLKKYHQIDAQETLNLNEITEALDMASQYDHFFAHISGNHIEFSPKIAGAGYLGNCEADLAVDDTLYEIKAVSRNIAGKDIKQLILYLALQYSTGSRKWINAGFFNPRKAMHYKFSVDYLIYRTSGGRSTSEVLMDITDHLASRGIEIDAIF